MTDMTRKEAIEIISTNTSARLTGREITVLASLVETAELEFRRRRSDDPVMRRIWRQHIGELVNIAVKLEAQRGLEEWE